MKLVHVLVLCFAPLVQSTTYMPAVIHALASLKPVNTIFSSDRTINWLTENVIIKNFSVLGESIPKVQTRIAMLKDNESPEDKARMQYYVRMHANMICDMAYIMTHDVCEYIKSLHGRTLPKYMHDREIVFANTPVDSNHREVLIKLMLMLKKIRPLRQIYKWFDENAFVICNNETVGAYLNREYYISAYLAQTDVYIPSDSGCRLITACGAVSETRCPTEGVDAYMLTAHMAIERFPGPLKTDGSASTPVPSCTSSESESAVYSSEDTATTTEETASETPIVFVEGVTNRNSTSTAPQLSEKTQPLVVSDDLDGLRGEVSPHLVTCVSLSMLMSFYIIFFL